MTEHETVRRSALVTGAAIGVLIAVLFAFLLVTLDGRAVTTARVLIVLVLLAGWALWCATQYGQAPSEADDH